MQIHIGRTHIHIPRKRTLDFDETKVNRVKSGPEAGEFTSKGGGAGSSKAESKTTTTKKEFLPGQKPLTGKQAHLVYAPNRDNWPDHIKKLAVPPGWNNVRISMDPKQDMQVAAEDSKGRTVYKRLKSAADKGQAKKYKRVQKLDQNYDRFVADMNKGLRSTDSDISEHATVTQLILEMGLRPGSTKDTGAEKTAYGATTLQADFVKTDDNGNVILDFTGKKGVDLKLPVKNEKIAKDLQERARKANAGDSQLFPSVNDRSLRAYISKLGGGGFLTKDLRTLKANRIANNLVLNSQSTPKNAKEFKKMTYQVALAVSEQLGNTPTVAMQNYINPIIFHPWKAWQSASS